MHFILYQPTVRRETHTVCPDESANSHCDWEDIAGSGDGHARAKHHLLAVSVQHAVVRVPG